MEGVVEWTEQERHARPDAAQLLALLRQAGDAVAQCVGECPLGMLAQSDAAPAETPRPGQP